MSEILRVRGVSAWYGEKSVLQGITLDVVENEILGVIGPAGGGKTTFLRSLNRMNDLTPGFRIEGDVLFQDVDVYSRPVDVATLRRCLGMVFAVPVPLPGTIYENLLLPTKLKGAMRDDILVERNLRSAFLWDEVKDRLHTSALALSGGQQQRLCLARTLMLEPAVLLLDEPCSGLDPISTAKIEEALCELKKTLTVVLVTNNVMQASRVADRTAFFLDGRLVEIGETKRLFIRPENKVTSDYITGHFG